MNDLQKIEQEKSVLRWGGLSAMLGVILFLVAIVAAMILVGDDPPTLVESVTRFPDVKTYRVIENLAYLLGLVLQVPLFLALYRALQKTSLAPALFGAALGILGLVALVVSTTPHVAHARLADLYNAPGATPADQATIALMWQVVWGMIDVMVYIGFFVIPLGLFALGAAMFSAPAFGKGYGWLTIVLGAIGFAAAMYQMVDTASMAAFGSYLAYIVFYLVLGWKLFSLSRGSSEVLESQMGQPLAMTPVSPRRSFIGTTFPGRQAFRMTSPFVRSPTASRTKAFPN